MILLQLLTLLLVGILFDVLHEGSSFGAHGFEHFQWVVECLIPKSGKEIGMSRAKEVGTRACTPARCTPAPVESFEFV